MASVTSLGLHKPTGLQYAIQEHLVPSEPSSTSYEWHNHFNGDSTSSLEDDELLVTPRCVIWSRGGVFRKAFKFDLEKEDVTRALITTFPSLGPLAAKENKVRQQKGNAAKRETAIVVFLKTQAHVYFLSGTSHVIHLPFEVESATAAPNGLIIQRKLRVENMIAASLKFPRVPPNSFLSSQPQPWSAASSQQSTFSIAELGGPKQMPMPHSTMKDMWDPPAVKNDSNWPRLFSLSDPLAEIGLVVAQPARSSKQTGRRSSVKTAALDTAEEILHVTRRDEFSPKNSERPLILALTLNRETSTYSVWKFTYVGDEPLPANGEKRRVASGTMSRRRSSFIPGSATGATTPTGNGQHTFRESLGGAQQGLGLLKSSLQDEARDKVVDFASSLDPDYESTSIPRRKSRRVSSMLARADLSATHERSAFADLTGSHAHATSRRGDSLGSQHARISIGPYPGVPGGSLSQAPQFNHSLNGYLEAPVDDLLDELRAGGDFEGFHNMGLDDDEFDALRQEVVLSKVCSVPAEHSNVRYSSQHTGVPGGSLSQAPQFNHSLNGYLEAPVDDLLDELRAGGDFEGFHNMGLDDDEFDALRQEVVLSKVCSVPAEHSNVRYSSQHMPAATQCKIFTLTAPPSAADDRNGNTIIICLLDPDEKRLLVMTLHSKTHKADVDLINNHVPGVKSERDVTVVSLASSNWAKGVIDACRLDDGRISRILALTQSQDGYGELSLQAPWSTLMKVTLPAQFAISNIRNLGHDPTPRAKREGGFKRVLSRGPRALCGLRNSKPGGIVDLVDDDGRMHQLQLVLEPRNPHVCRILEVCRAVLPAGNSGDGVLVCWWNVMQWLRLESIHTGDEEWTALIITLFSMVLSMGSASRPAHAQAKKKVRKGHLRSSSGVQLDLESWDLMQADEAALGNPSPSWASNAGWKWLTDENGMAAQSSESLTSIFTSTDSESLPFVRKHVDLARRFASTKFGSDSIFGSLPTSGNRSLDTRKAALTDVFIALHLLHEEQKLDTMMAEAFSTGLASLAPITAQIGRWLGWDSWIQHYEVEDASLLNIDYDAGAL